MQILHVDGKQIRVARAFQTNIGAALIIETPEGKYIYKNGEDVPPTALAAAGLAVFKAEEISFEKGYSTIKRASYAMVQKGVADRFTRKSSTHKIVLEGEEYFVRKNEELGEAEDGSNEMPEV